MSGETERDGLSSGELGDHLLGTKSFPLVLGKRYEMEKVGQSKEKLGSSGVPEY